MPTNLPGPLPNIPFLWPGEYSPKTYASKESSKEIKTYDYIICGGGTAGAVLANRLSANPSKTVLVLEAGYSDNRQLFSRIPAAFSFIFQKEGDWFYETVPQPQLNNRQLFWPRGKMLGGSSSINALIYQRCSGDTYDEWAAQGNKGWDWKSLKPYFDKAENYTDNPDYAGEVAHHPTTKGPWKTRVGPFTSSVSKKIIDAAVALGIPKVADLNNPQTQVGVVRTQTTTDEKGRRHSTSQAFLTKDVLKRKNLTIGVGATISKLIFSADKKRAIGVEFVRKKGGQKWIVHARQEVMICAGAIGSPQLLLLSGIGPASQLETHKVPVVVDRPGVGENLQDHLTAGLVFYSKSAGLEYLKHEIKSGPAFMQWLFAGKGPLTSNVAEVAAFYRHEDLKHLLEGETSLPLIPPPGVPDLELLTGPVNYLDHALQKMPGKNYVSCASIHIQPTSRGNIRLKDSSVWSKPLIDPNYLATENDRRALRFGMEIAMKLTEVEPLKSEIIRAYDFEKPKNFKKHKGLGEYRTMGEEKLMDMTRDAAFTIYHPVGTCKMGPASDPGAVVDACLKVHGIEGLRVVDASIMPVIVRGHPQAAVVAIAEKAADMILTDLSHKHA